MYIGTYTGIDYLVNIQYTSSRTFTVAFQMKQANSTEHVTFISDDECYEGPEYFRLRIVAALFVGQEAALFRAQDGLLPMYTLQMMTVSSGYQPVPFVC